MVLLDLLGRRWTLRVLWEVHRRPGQTFRELQASCGDMSSSVLVTRLRELRANGLLDHAEHGYLLTSDGEGLLQQLLGLEAWAEQWARSREQSEE